jgi:hypothetical protein
MLLISPLQFKNCLKKKKKNYIRPTVSHKRSLELGVTCEILFSHRLVEINKRFCGLRGLGIKRYRLSVAKPKMEMTLAGA